MAELYGMVSETCLVIKRTPLISWVATIDDFDAGIDKAILESKFKEGIRNADPDRFLVWSGTAVTLMSEVKPAKVSRRRPSTRRLSVLAGHC